MIITRKQKWYEKLYGCFNRLISNISHEKTWTWLKKGNFKRETESLLIAAQKKKKRTCHLVNFDVPANHRVKIKQAERYTDT